MTRVTVVMRAALARCLWFNLSSVAAQASLRVTIVVVHGTMSDRDPNWTYVAAHPTR